MTPRMSPARARATRIDQLAADVAAGARCATPKEGEPQPDDWFRRDGEQLEEWYARRMDLVRYCVGCPVMTQCREVALRTDARSQYRSTDDYVRGGMTGLGLARTRRSDQHRASLDRAMEADGRHGERELLAAHRYLQRIATALKGTTDRAWTEANNAETREAAQTVRRLRTERRRAAGWETAA